MGGDTVALWVRDSEEGLTRLGIGHHEITAVGKMYRVKTLNPLQDYGVMGERTAVAFAVQLSESGYRDVIVEEWM